MRGAVRRVAIGLIAVLALIGMSAVASGCGGGSDEPETLTKSAFVTEGNEICANAEEERKQDSEDLSADDEEAAATEALSAPVATMVEELNELGPPRGDAGKVKAIVAAFEDGIANLEGESVGSELFSAFAKANELALAYGLTDCRV